jgi:hypothetical protein
VRGSTVTCTRGKLSVDERHQRVDGQVLPRIEAGYQIGEGAAA